MTARRCYFATSISISPPIRSLFGRWYIELPIRSPLDERTREGDDHPARLFLRFLTDRGDTRAMAVIWGNRLKAGDYKYIGGFPHFVADAGEDRVGRWLDERIDLARVYAEIWKDAAPAHLVDVAVFCDSDDTHTSSVSYFADVGLERRLRAGVCRSRCRRLNKSLRWGDLTASRAAVHVLAPVRSQQSGRRREDDIS
jgi:hypothetical protein